MPACMAADARKFLPLGGASSTTRTRRGEYYLTDVPALAKADGVACAVATAEKPRYGRQQPRRTGRRPKAQMQQRLRAKALAAGVGMTAPETVFSRYDTVLEADVEIEPFVVFGPGVTVTARRARSAATRHLEGAEVGRGRHHRSLARLAPRRGDRRRRPYRQFRGSEERRDRQRRQGQSSHLSGRCRGRRGRQYRRGHHHLQL